MSVALRAARRQVVSFADECDIMKCNHEAGESQDCESVLQLGIDAFTWLVRADERVRSAAFAGGEYDPAVDSAIRELFQAWLRTCDPVNKWIDNQIASGHHLSNLEEFRNCEREVRSLVKSLDADAMTDAMRELRDSAVQEHRSGETAEFV
jgi:hypothetical protein